MGCELKITTFHSSPRLCCSPSLSPQYPTPSNYEESYEEQNGVLWGSVVLETLLETSHRTMPWSSTTNLFLLLSGTPQIQRVMTMMIRDHEVLFPKSKDVPLSPPAPKNDPKKPPVARSSVGWDASEDVPISRTDSFSNTVRCREPLAFHMTLPLIQVIPCQSCCGWQFGEFLMMLWLWVELVQTHGNASFYFILLLGARAY